MVCIWVGRIWVPKWTKLPSTTCHELMHCCYKNNARDYARASESILAILLFVHVQDIAADKPFSEFLLMY